MGQESNENFAPPAPAWYNVDSYTYRRFNVHLGEPCVGYYLLRVHKFNGEASTLRTSQAAILMVS